MADWGIKISVDGSEVTSAADKDLCYSSKYNGMKILKHNTANAGNVAHGVSGYVPSFINYVLTGSKYRLNNYIFSANSDYANTTNLVLGNNNNYYFIFVDKGD